MTFYKKSHKGTKQTRCKMEIERIIDKRIDELTEKLTYLRNLKKEELQKNADERNIRILDFLYTEIKSYQLAIQELAQLLKYNDV